MGLQDTPVPVGTGVFALRIPFPQRKVNSGADQNDDQVGKRVTDTGILDDLHCFVVLLGGECIDGQMLLILADHIVDHIPVQMPEYVAIFVGEEVSLWIRGCTEWVVFRCFPLKMDFVTSSACNMYSSGGSLQ